MRICALLFVACCFLSGCGEPEHPAAIPQPGASPPAEQIEAALYKNFFNQAVVRVSSAELDKWLMLNRDCEIVSITSECQRLGDQNPTTHFIIVYKVKAK